MKSRILRGAGIAIVALLAAAIFWLANLVWFRPFNIDHFYDRVFLQYALKNPEMLSSLRMLPPWADWYNDELTDRSPEQDRVMLDLSKDALETLRSYDFDEQTPQQQLSTRILDWFLETAVKGEPWLYHNYPVNQLFGVQNSLPDFMAEQHQVNDEGEAEDYIARLAKFEEAFRQLD